MLKEPRVTVRSIGTAAGVKVNAEGRTAALEPTLPTARSTRAPCGPTGKAGARALIWPELTMLTLKRLRPPRVTIAPCWKFDPRMVTGVPPDDGPEVGEIDVTPGTSACPRMTSGSPTSP